jgi:hypothetical protein
MMDEINSLLGFSRNGDVTRLEDAACTTSSITRIQMVKILPARTMGVPDSIRVSSNAPY